jgi:hypothetical protein
MQDAKGGFSLVALASLPADLVQGYGAPAQVRYNISSPGNDSRLLMDILWVNKTATRLPEVRFTPHSAPK